jgi:hypothetical protein
MKRLLASLALLLRGSIAAQESVPASDLMTQGERLAAQVCATCHALPKPSELDQSSWRNGALPMMRRRLGLDHFSRDDPEQRAVLDDFEIISRYYIASAPERIVETNLPPILAGLPGFTVVRSNYRPTNQMVSLLHIDAASRRILAGNQETKTLDVLDSEGRMRSSLPVESPPIHFVRDGDDLYVTLIWNLSPHEERKGRVLKMRLVEDRLTHVTEVLSGLARPVHTSIADLQGFGIKSLIVSGFGFLTGNLASWSPRPDRSWTQTVMYDQPGALKTDVRDWTGDGRPDVLAMVAQGREGLLLYRNTGEGRFAEERMAEQSPTWGSSGFDVADFDGDGRPDLITANGDTGEFASCNRPYHGVRILLNRPGPRGPRFEQAFHFPLHGAYAVRAIDYDGDGDLDIAATSFFPDYRARMEESFVLLENEGGMKFTARTFEHVPSGRWINMDAGDIDGDGDIDIVLGAGDWVAFPVLKDLAARWKADPLSLLILRNDRKKTAP